MRGPRREVRGMTRDSGLFKKVYEKFRSMGYPPSMAVTAANQELALIMQKKSRTYRRNPMSIFGPSPFLPNYKKNPEPEEEEFDIEEEELDLSKAGVQEPEEPEETPRNIAGPEMHMPRPHPSSTSVPAYEMVDAPAIEYYIYDKDTTAFMFIETEAFKMTPPIAGKRFTRHDDQEYRIVEVRGNHVLAKKRRPYKYAVIVMEKDELKRAREAKKKYQALKAAQKAGQQIDEDALYRARVESIPIPRYAAGAETKDKARRIERISHRSIQEMINKKTGRPYSKKDYKISVVPWSDMSKYAKLGFRVNPLIIK